MKTLAALIAVCLLVPAVADAGGKLTFRQARKAMHAQQAKQRTDAGPSGENYFFSDEHCRRTSSRRVVCAYRVRNGEYGSKCQYKVVVKRRGGRVRSRLYEDFASTPWCNS